MFCVFKTKINCTSWSGSDIVQSWLLSGNMVRCRKKRPSWFKTVQHTFLLTAHTKLISTTCMPVYLRVDKRLSARLVMRNILLWKFHIVWIIKQHRAQTPIHAPQDIPPGVSSQSPFPKTNSRQQTILCRAMIAWSSPIAQANSKITVKNILKRHLMEQ